MESTLAYEELVDLYSAQVYKFCQKLTFSKGDADDLFQDTFVKIFEQYAKLEATDNVLGFLFSSALYVWKSKKRKYARRKRIAHEQPLSVQGVFAVSSQNVEEEFAAKEQARAVREVVDGLGDKFKIPIILHYTMEQNLNEIATTLDVPVGTVKSRLYKARKLIEKGLKKNGYGY